MRLEQDALLDGARVELGADFGEVLWSPDGARAAAYQGVFSTLSDLGFSVVLDVASHRVTRLNTGAPRTTIAAFSGDGLRLATGGRDNLVRVFDARTGRTLRELAGHNAVINDLHFADNGLEVLSASEDGTVKLWGANGGARLSLGHRAAAFRAVFGGDDRIITSTADGLVHVWLSGANAPLFSLYGHASRLVGFVVSPRAGVLTQASDGMLRRWSLEGTATRQLSTGGLASYAFPAPDGRTVVAVSDSAKVTRVDVESGRLLEQWSLASCTQPSNVAVSGGDAPFVAAGQGRVVCLSTWGQATAAALSGHTDSVRQFEFSPDGSLLVTTGADGLALIWSTTTHEVMARLKHDTPLWGASFSADQERVAVAAQDGTIHVWQWRVERKLRSWQAHADGVWAAQFVDHDRRVLSSALDQQVALWNAESGALVRRFVGHAQQVYFARLDPTGTRIASVDQSGTIIVWDLEHGVAVDRLQLGVHGFDVRWLPDGSLVSALDSVPGVAVYETHSNARHWRCQNPLEWQDGQIVSRTAWPAECQGLVATP